MSSRRLKTGFFILEGINAFAAAYYFNYLFFYLQKHFGFGNLGNLVFSALNGFIYIFSALYGGRFAQKHGYFLALNLGFCGMAAALLCGLFLPTAPGQLLVMLFWTVAVCFTWPTLEAMVSEGEDLHGLPRIVGIYNIVWASGASLAFFSGGAIVQALGWKSLFWLPASLHCFQLIFAFWLEKLHGPVSSVAVSPPPGDPDEEGLGPADLAASGAALSGNHREAVWAESNPAQGGVALEVRAADSSRRSIASSFLRMAWVANPLAYMAINTALPLMPDIARRLELSPMLAGFVCSAWMFARLGSFIVLWRWTAWHYRFGWLLSSYLLLIASFTGLLLSPQLWAVVLSEIVFGWAIGLIYYSSLFYSMDASESKGVHGGVHEAAIGLGICTGPTLGALALGFFPSQANVSAWAVSGLLATGLVVLVGLRRR